MWQVWHGYNVAQENHSCFNISKWYFQNTKCANKDSFYTSSHIYKYIVDGFNFGGTKTNHQLSFPACVTIPYWFLYSWDKNFRNILENKITQFQCLVETSRRYLINENKIIKFYQEFIIYRESI